MTEHVERDSEGNKIGVDSSKMVAGVTRGGKKLNIFLDRTGYYKVRYTDGGQLPQSLSGKFTSYQTAEDEIKVYLHKQYVKAKRQVKKIQE